MGALCVNDTSTVKNEFRDVPEEGSYISTFNSKSSPNKKSVQGNALVNEQIVPSQVTLVKKTSKIILKDQVIFEERASENVQSVLEGAEQFDYLNKYNIDLEFLVPTDLLNLRENGTPLVIFIY